VEVVRQSLLVQTHEDLPLLRELEVAQVRWHSNVQGLAHVQVVAVGVHSAHWARKMIWLGSYSHDALALVQQTLPFVEPKTPCGARVRWLVGRSADSLCHPQRHRLRRIRPILMRHPC